MTGERSAALVALGVVLAATVPPFFVATTFFGDDHLFLAFARHVHHPLLAFTTDLHGGEYYRPLWMAFWWLLARAGSVWPFALAALTLHAAAAALVGLLLRALRRPPRVAASAAALMFLAPQNLAAALWFSATTDLLATVLVLASLLALVRGRPALAALGALGAYFSKESSFVLPALAWIVVQTSAAGAERRLARRAAIVPQVVLLGGVVVIRRAILHGWGGSGDPRVGLVGTALQIFAGFAQVFTGDGILPVPLSLAVGTTILALTLLAIARKGRGGALRGGALMTPGQASALCGADGTAAVPEMRPRARWAPIAFAAVAAAPLVAAGWAVGERYYYLPAVGLCWAVAEALADVGQAARVTLVGALVLLGLAQSTERRQEVISYDRRVAAARRAVATGLGAGHHVFHVDGGIQDLDLAVKEAPALEAGQVLVLSDVPASFVIIPARLQPAAQSLIATPPLPPSGAYRFGDVRVVGLARRGDEPDLDEALSLFPDLRFIRLRSIRGGRVVARDLTAEIKRRLDAEPVEGQD